MTTLSTAQVLRHAADNVEAGRALDHGLEGRASSGCGWIDFRNKFALICLNNAWQFRLAPRTITYTVKDQPEPLRVAPEIGTLVYLLDGCAINNDTDWRGTDWQLAALARGNIFATKEDAEAADAARLAGFKAGSKT